jgi:PAS domain S-box-containing protein
MMKDEDKTKEQLIRELVEMRQQVAELEAADSERKRAEEELKELLEKIKRAKQEWESTADSLPDLVCLVDDEGRIIRANRTVETWNLGRVVDVKGRGVHELLHPGCADSSCYLDSFWKKAWEEAIRGQPAQCEAYDEVLKFHVLIRVEPWKDWGKGTALGCTVVVVRDITERKRTEEALQESEERLRLVVQNMPIMLDALDADNNIIVWNQECERVTGYSADEIVSNPKALELLYPDKAYLQRVLAEWAERSDSFRDWELELISKDGNAKTVSWSNLSQQFPIPGWDSWAVGVDITERKRAEEALRESEERYRTLFEGVPIGLYRTTPEGQIVDVNAALVQILGYPDRESLLALNVPDGYMDPEERRRWQALMEHEGAVHGFEVQWRRGDGAAIWVKEDARLVRDPEGRVLYYDGAVEDITERKQAQEALRESEERYRSLINDVLDSSAVGIFILDSGFRIVWVNQALERYFGLRRDEIIGKDKRQLIRERIKNTFEDPESFAENVLATYDDNTYIENFECHVLPDGEREERWLEHWSQPIRSGLHAGGRIEHYTDITERVRAEEALEESNRQLESRERFISGIVESIPSSLLVIDQRLQVVSVNRNFLEKSRREEQATLGRKIEEVFPQPLVEYTQLNQKVWEVFRTGEPLEGGKVAYRAPGLPTRIYYYRLIPLHLSPDGEREKVEKAVENVMLLMDDITEQEKLGEEVRRAERHLASVVDSAYDLVVSMDPEGKILTWNRTAERTSGLELEEVKGQYLPDLCVEEEQQEMALWLAQWAKGQFTKKSIEINLRTKKGKEVPISWTGSRMVDDEHRIVGLVAVGRDLTERKRLEAQLIQSAKLTSLGVMAGGIAHEIRNPLAISSAAAQLLLERPDDEQLRKEAVEKIYSGVQRTSYIIENLLKFARPPEERMVPTNITGALEETISLLANQLRVQRVKLRKDLTPDLPQVVGNRPLLQQVFSNMILNACNAMPDGGSLTVATRATKAEIEIQFADTGVGIPTEHLSKIFDPFFTTMPVGKGVGLGLSISYSIIQQHQGTIDVASQVGQGTIFTIRLPVGSG